MLLPAVYVRLSIRYSPLFKSVLKTVHHSGFCDPVTSHTAVRHTVTVLRRSDVVIFMVIVLIVIIQRFYLVASEM